MLWFLDPVIISITGNQMHFYIDTDAAWKFGETKH